jgi:hypothetical protein
MLKAVSDLDFDSARHAMVEYQIKLRGTRDSSVLHALLQVPLFVESEFLSQTYSALQIKKIGIFRNLIRNRILQV